MNEDMANRAERIERANTGVGTATDVIIVGGGPVGLATALYAAESGLRPLVLEPRTGVIDKACGEGLMPGALQALAGLGVDPPGHQLRGIRYLSGAHRAEADFAHGPGRGVRRLALHAALREAVTSAGVEVLPLAAQTVTQTGDRVSLATTQHRGTAGPTLGSRWLIAADGLHSPTRRALNLDRDRRPSALQRYGQRRHYATQPWTDYVEVHWGSHGEAYVTPVDEDLVGIAILTSRRIPLQDSLTDFPELQERLAGVPVQSAVRGAGPLRQRSNRRVEGRVLLVGDASGYVDALTGEGIALGLAHAHAAVAAIREERPQTYEQAWRRASWRYALLTHALVQTTRPTWVRRHVVPAAAALPPLFNFAVNQLARPTRKT